MKRVFIVALPLLVLFGCGGRNLNKIALEGAADKQSASVSQSVAGQKVATPVRYGFKVVAEYPHATSSYTQGLLWHDGYLYEGTGQYGQSMLKCVHLTTGTDIRAISLGQSLFGEGITLHGDKIYQLTWQEGQCKVYQLSDFRPVRTIRYDGEGWGLASDGEHLYMSDGSDRIVVRDPETFRAVREFTVRTDRGNVQYLNELEWVDGELWANVYTTNMIVRINPENGHVVGIIELEGLQKRADKLPTDDVLNGIAYDAATGRIWVTGKNWNKLYEIELKKK